MLGRHGESQPSGGPASQLHHLRAESDRDARWGRQQPHKTYHGRAGNKASTFTPSHTYTAQPTRDSRGEQNKEKTRALGDRPLFWGPIGGLGGWRWERAGGCGACRGSPGAHLRRTRRGAGARAHCRGRVPRAAPLGAHVPGCNRAPGPPPPPPATAAAEGRAGPGKRRRPRRRRRRPLGEAPPASRPAQAQSGGPACERRRPRRPRAAAAGGDGPRLPRGMSRRPSRRAGRRRRCAGSCCSCSRSPGAAPRAPSASRPWTPEAARGLKAAAAAAWAEGKWNPGPGRGCRAHAPPAPGAAASREEAEESALLRPVSALGAGRGCPRAGRGRGPVWSPGYSFTWWKLRPEEDEASFSGGLSPGTDIYRRSALSPQSCDVRGKRAVPGRNCDTLVIKRGWDNTGGDLITPPPRPPAWVMCGKPAFFVLKWNL